MCIFVFLSEMRNTLEIWDNYSQNENLYFVFLNQIVEIQEIHEIRGRNWRN